MDLSCLDRRSPAFPPHLLHIPDPPTQLWLRGDASLLTRTAVAIVGSRRASPASLDIARRLAADLARVGLAVVSGLARGCDAAAHRGALHAGASRSPSWARASTSSILRNIAAWPRRSRAAACC